MGAHRGLLNSPSVSPWWAISPRAASSHGPFPEPGSPLEGIWPNSQRRFETRSRASGFLHADVLWKEALGQAERGWLAPPLPIDIDCSGATYAHGSVKISLRLGVDQADKLRACDDLNHNDVDLYFTVWPPIKLPTWDRIAQMRLNVRPSRETREFPNADREAAYKQLPMRPAHANLAMVALRDPITSRRIAFHPKALPFGPTSAVLRYSCFSRLSATLFDGIFGIP